MGQGKDDTCEEEGATASPSADQSDAAWAERLFGQAFRSPDGASPDLPDQIGPYKVVKVLGSGGFGTVYLAKDSRQRDRVVAVKVLKLAPDSADALRRFQREHESLARMSHPSLSRVFEPANTGGGLAYYAMDFIDGEPLTAHCDHEQLTIRGRLELFLKVVDAVHHAHLKGVLHRDLKPANILVSKPGIRGREATPCVIDFGLAKLVGEASIADSLATSPGTFIGTPAYMSPEQAAGSSDIDVRTDVYSLGVILYELLTGSQPIDLSGASIVESLRRIREVEPARPASVLRRLGARADDVARVRQSTPRRLAREIQGDLGRIVLKALDKNPDHRYQSALDLLRDIDRYLSHEPVLATRPSILYRLRKWAARNRAAAAVLAAAAIVSLGAWIAVEWREAVRRDALAERTRQALAGADVEAAIAAVTALREAPGGSELAEQAGREVARSLLDDAKAAWGRCREAKEQAIVSHARRQEEALREPRWRPSWDRQIELEHLRTHRQARRDATEHFNAAMATLTRALQLASPEWDEHLQLRTFLTEVSLSLAADERREEAVFDLESYFRRLAERQNVPAFADEVAGRQTVRLESDPPGAEVHCFRYEEHEARLLPLAFHPRTGVAGKPFLRIDRVYEPALSPFQAGDRLLALSGRPLALSGDLARALKDVPEGAAVEVRVERGSREQTLQWVPFPGTSKWPETWRAKLTAIAEATQAARVVHFYSQFGFTLEGYPLELTPAKALGLCEADRPLEHVFPRGSYLFLLEREGFAPTRLPIVVPSLDARAGSVPAAYRVRLVREEALPPGFVYVPEGDVFAGGDPDTWGSLAAGVRHVKGFFLSQHEVTVSEWLEFLADPEIAARSSKELALLPGVTKHPEWPVLKVSHSDALEFIRWRTARGRQQGKPWTYRLPTDEEWERAARGVDRRRFVWGDYFVPSLAWSYWGIPYDRAPVPPGVTPTDESPFGVRDMAGSLTEHTTGEPVPGQPNKAYRGGSLDHPDEEPYHAASRSSLPPGQEYRYFGLRLAADLVP